MNIMKTEFTKMEQPVKQKRCAQKTKRLISMIAFGTCCGFLLGHPGCATPGHLPRPPGLSMASVAPLNSQAVLYLSVVH
jgi:hypothetical protein